MKQVLLTLVFAMFVFLTSFATAQPRASLVAVSAKRHHGTHRHHAHKAGKHPHPKRHHHSV